MGRRPNWADSDAWETIYLIRIVKSPWFGDYKKLKRVYKEIMFLIN